MLGNRIEERKKYSTYKINDKENTQIHRDFTLETQTGKPTFLERLSLLLSYSF
jgi:hypothetical protein